MNRRFTFAITAAVAFVTLAGPALAAPGKKGPAGKHDQAGAKVVVVTPAPYGPGLPGKAKPTKVVFEQGPAVDFSPRVIVSAQRPMAPLASQVLRARIERAAAQGRLTKRELRALSFKLVKLEQTERRFFRSGGRLDRSEQRTLARLATGLELAFEQAVRGPRHA
jgi:hypothetical protein